MPANKKLEKRLKALEKVVEENAGRHDEIKEKTKWSDSRGAIFLQITLTVAALAIAAGQFWVAKNQRDLAQDQTNIQKYEFANQLSEIKGDTLAINSFFAQIELLDEGVQTNILSLWVATKSFDYLSMHAYERLIFDLDHDSDYFFVLFVNQLAEEFGNLVDLINDSLEEDKIDEERIITIENEILKILAPFRLFNNRKLDLNFSTYKAVFSQTDFQLAYEYLIRDRFPDLHNELTGLDIFLGSETAVLADALATLRLELIRLIIPMKLNLEGPVNVILEDYLTTETTNGYPGFYWSYFYSVEEFSEFDENLNVLFYVYENHYQTEKYLLDDGSDTTENVLLRRRISKLFFFDDLEGVDSLKRLDDRGEIPILMY